MKNRSEITALDRKIIKKRIVFTIILSVVAICCIVGMILVFIYCKKK